MADSPCLVATPVYEESHLSLLLSDAGCEKKNNFLEQTVNGVPLWIVLAIVGGCVLLVIIAAVTGTCIMKQQDRATEKSMSSPSNLE